MNGIIIDVNKYNTKVARVSDGRLQEFRIEEHSALKLVGNIYTGVVVSVLPGMQAAFVDIGCSRNVYLSAQDLPAESTGEEPQIFNLLVGDKIMCQVIKDEFGTKAARVSTKISIAGRHIVSTPTDTFVGVSRKIEDEAERQRLIDIVLSLKFPMGGILRTAAQSASTEDLRAEIAEHAGIWKHITSLFEKSSVGDILYREDNLASRALRDILTPDVKQIITNNMSVLNDIDELKLLGKINSSIHAEYMPSGDGLLTATGLQPQIDMLLENKVWLKGGGYLIIDKTEALTVVDVNSGKYIGSKVLEDTVYQVNIRAAEEIARQLRLRNIGGIVVVDFIDMALEEHKAGVLERLERELKKDRIKCRVAGMTSLGLVEITRKKIENDITYYLQQPCSACKGSGMIMAPSTISNRIARKLSEIIGNSAYVSAIVIKISSQSAGKLYGGELSDKCATIWEGIRIYLEPDETFESDYFEITVFSDNTITLSDNAKLLY